MNYYPTSQDICMLSRLLMFVAYITNYIEPAQTAPLANIWLPVIKVKLFYYESYVQGNCQI